MLPNEYFCFCGCHIQFDVIMLPQTNNIHIGILLITHINISGFFFYFVCFEKTIYCPNWNAFYNRLSIDCKEFTQYTICNVICFDFVWFPFRKWLQTFSLFIYHSIFVQIDPIEIDIPSAIFYEIFLKKKK